LKEKKGISKWTSNRESYMVSTYRGKFIIGWKDVWKEKKLGKEWFIETRLEYYDLLKWRYEVSLFWTENKIWIQEDWRIIDKKERYRKGKYKNKIDCRR